jgi:hypothetical protein
MAISTASLAKWMGLSLVLLDGALIADKPATVQTVNALFADQPLLFITGVFTTMFGLAIVLAHNRWSGGALGVVVTLYGWIALLKGLTFLWLPPAVQANAWQSLHFEQYFYVYMIFSLAVGGYLTYGGFKAEV